MPPTDRTELPYLTEPLETIPVLAADSPPERAFDAGGAPPLFLVDGPDGLRAGSMIALRFLVQDEPERGRRIADATDDSLVCPTAEAAAARLDREPELEAAVIDAGGGAPAQLLRRRVPDVATALIMAGGLGMRLRPLTENTPKPLLEVAGRSLLFRLLDELSAQGVRRVFISINYLGHMVREAVGDGSEWGMEAGYLEESEPLDTGAGLVQLDPLDEPFFVVNGDILTKLDFRAMGRFHVLYGGLGTVATYRYAAPLPYGVVRSDLSRVHEIAEKPVFEYPVNAGAYVFSGEASRIVPKGRPLAMVDFLNEHAGEGRIHRFPLVEEWNDVGSPEVLARAQQQLWSST